MRKLRYNEREQIRLKIADWIKHNLVEPGKGIQLAALFDKVGAGGVYYSVEHNYPLFDRNETVTRRSFRLLVRQVMADKKSFGWSKDFDVRFAQTRVLMKKYKKRMLKNGTIMQIPYEKEQVLWCVVHTTPEIVRGNLVWRDLDHGGMIKAYGAVEADTGVTRRMDASMDAVDEVNTEKARTGLVPDTTVPPKPRLRTK